MYALALGPHGPQVSALCLGAARLGARVDKAMSFALMDLYAEAGGGFIDTANIYGRGEDLPGASEIVIGEWLRARNNRGRVFVASKVGFPYPGIEAGTSARQIEDECEKSLRKLGVEAIDLYYAHNDDRATPLEESLGAFARLVRSGKVRYIGASNFLAWRLEAAAGVSRARGWPEYCCIQQRHTYLRPRPGANFEPQKPSNDDLLDYCRVHGLRLLAYSPLLNGAYVRPDRQFPAQYLGSDSNARLTMLRTVAAETGGTLNQVILAWMLQSQPPVLPLVSASTPQHLRENLGALDIRLTAEQMARLDQAGA